MLFPMILITFILLSYSELVTRKFSFCLLYRVSNLEFVIFDFFELVTQKSYFELLFRAGNLKNLICLFNSS